MLISNNGPNFVSSAKILKSWEEHHRVRGALNQNKCKWHFNPSRALWFGGFFKRIVKMVKLCLQKTLHRAIVTEDELHTVLCDIEEDLNDRPLTSVSDLVDFQLGMLKSFGFGNAEYSAKCRIFGFGRMQAEILPKFFFRQC
jgi:hypothetical protein